MAGGPKIRIEAKKLLIVEGRDEENFFKAAFLSPLRIQDVQILPIGGKTLLVGNLKGLRNDPAFPDVVSIGVVRDADFPGSDASSSAARSALDALRSAFASVGCGNAAALSHGCFVEGTPRLGAFVMPDGASDGMLESLCMKAVEGRPEHRCVEEFLNCCVVQGCVSGDTPKARAHAWLSSRELPDKRVGEAALAGYWPFESPAFEPLWAFLRLL